jgi:hypothetical protein
MIELQRLEGRIGSVASVKGCSNRYDTLAGRRAP